MPKVSPSDLKPLSIALTPGMIATLDRLRADTGLTRSAFVRWLLERAMANGYLTKHPLKQK